MRNTSETTLTLPKCQEKEGNVENSKKTENTTWQTKKVRPSVLQSHWIKHLTKVQEETVEKILCLLFKKKSVHSFLSVMDDLLCYEVKETSTEHETRHQCRGEKN